MLRNEFYHIAFGDADNLKEIATSIVEVEKTTIILTNHREGILWWKGQGKLTTPKLSRMLFANVTDFIVLFID